MSEPKTRPTGASVDAFLEAVPAAGRRADGLELRDLMREATGVDRDVLRELIADAWSRLA